MSPSSEDLASAPAAGQPEPAATESAPPLPSANGSPDAIVPEAAPERAPRRRRRRRRRKPAPAGIGSEAAAQNDAADITLESTAENAGAGESAADAPAIDAPAQAAAQPAADTASAPPPRRRRRRRRRPPAAEGQSSTPSETGDVTAIAAIEAAPEEPTAAGEAAAAAPAPTARPRRPRMRRPQRAALEVPGQEIPAGETPAGPPRRSRRRPRRGNAVPEADQRARRPRGNDGAPPERGRRERGEHGRNEQGRPRGSRRRGAPERSRAEPERRLYALEAVVDRGFEDVEEENETRRVHWTIVKRTVADQKSGRQMSALYVLQRDGVDQEFPNLGAARLAAHKTIVHPEKLTLSKAEHAAARGGGDGKK